MKFEKATALYEEWLGGRLRLLPADLRLKHRRMREEPFAFLRATYYRWAQLWPDLCPDLASAPEVLAVGDLHVENFGTWRDAEGRLVWGINDFDEAWRMPYANDLVRLATSAALAADGRHLAVDRDTAAEAILDGYRSALEVRGRPFVLAEEHPALRAMAVARLHDPRRFWDKLIVLRPVKHPVPAGARRALARMHPDPERARRIVHRVAGLGSLGRERYVLLGDWEGALVAREAKALAPSAAAWAERRRGGAIRYAQIVDRAVRCQDPFLRVQRRWIVRRLAPDCSRIELAALPKERDEVRLLRAMGWETANVHLGSAKARVLRKDVARRSRSWLRRAASVMRDAVREDYESWRATSGRARTA
ncbi:MAG TPA: DUF2252 family protein [Gemmatimonadales bacterium]|nr:DUF2252 family protein [Gemmatimonadales bacterium]